MIPMQIEWSQIELRSPSYYRSNFSQQLVNSGPRARKVVKILCHQKWSKLISIEELGKIFPMVFFLRKSEVVCARYGRSKLVVD